MNDISGQVFFESGQILFISRRPLEEAPALLVRLVDTRAAARHAAGRGAAVSAAPAALVGGPLERGRAVARGRGRGHGVT